MVKISQDIPIEDIYKMANAIGAHIVKSANGDLLMCYLYGRPSVIDDMPNFTGKASGGEYYSNVECENEGIVHALYACPVFINGEWQDITWCGMSIDFNDFSNYNKYKKSKNAVNCKECMQNKEELINEWRKLGYL